jgi:hypothetical protein
LDNPQVPALLACIRFLIIGDNNMFYIFQYDSEETVFWLEIYQNYGLSVKKYRKSEGETYTGRRCSTVGRRR